MGLHNKNKAKFIQLKVELSKTICEAHLVELCANKGSEILPQCAMQIMSKLKLPISMWHDKKRANNVPLAAQKKWT